MTLEELIALYRAQSLDAEAPYFCSDELLTVYANEAQDEACRRGQFLRDASSSLCTVAYAPGDESIALDPRIVRVLRASADSFPVEVLGAQQMADMMPAWQTGSAERPRILVSGLTQDRLYLWPKPTSAGQIKLHVLRFPLEKMANDSDTPEIRQEMHPALVEWMLYRAYSRTDADTQDDAKARTALRKFITEFGDKHGGRNEQWVRDGGSLMPGPIA